MGPIHGLQPSGTTWVNNFPHTAWQELSAYYIHAFKTGSYPTITVSNYFRVILPRFHQRHRWTLFTTGRVLTPPLHMRLRTRLDAPKAGTGFLYVPRHFSSFLLIEVTKDTLWAAAFLTAPSTVTLIAGSSSRVFKNVPAGVTRLLIPLAPGIINVKVERNGRTIISESAKGYKYESTPETCKRLNSLYIKYVKLGTVDNFNAWVGAASTSFACDLRVFLLKILVVSLRRHC